MLPFLPNQPSLGRDQLTGIARPGECPFPGSARRHHDLGFTFQHGLAAYGADGGEHCLALGGDEFLDGAAGGDGVADLDRGLELEGLGKVDGARAGEFGAEDGGDEARREHAVGDAAAKHGGGGEFFVHVNGVEVAGDAGEGEDVSFGDGARIGGALADRQILETVAVELLEVGGLFAHGDFLF